MKPHIIAALRTIWLAALTRPGLALLAALAGVGGAAVLTGLLAWALHALIGAFQWPVVGNLAYGLLLVVALVLWGLMRLLAGKQAIELELWKLKARLTSEGDDPPPVVTTTVTTETKVADAPPA